MKFLHNNSFFDWLIDFWPRLPLFTQKAASASGAIATALLPNLVSTKAHLCVFKRTFLFKWKWTRKHRRIRLTASSIAATVWLFKLLSNNLQKLQKRTTVSLSLSHTHTHSHTASFSAKWFFCEGNIKLWWISAWSTRVYTALVNLSGICLWNGPFVRRT